MDKKKIILTSAAIVVVAGVAVWAFSGGSKKQKVEYETATVSRQDISNFVTATGTIEPVTEVEVGTQVSGIIDKSQRHHRQNLCGLQHRRQAGTTHRRDG